MCEEEEEDERGCEPQEHSVLQNHQLRGLNLQRRLGFDTYLDPRIRRILILRMQVEEIKSRLPTTHLWTSHWIYI